MEPHDQPEISDVESSPLSTADANVPLTRRFAAERVTRIELAWPAWKYSTAGCVIQQTPARLTMSDAVGH